MTDDTGPTIKNVKLNFIVSLGFHGGKLSGYNKICFVRFTCHYNKRLCSSLSHRLIKSIPTSKYLRVLYRAHLGTWSRTELNKY